VGLGVIGFKISADDEIFPAIILACLEISEGTVAGATGGANIALASDLDGVTTPEQRKQKNE
jgi:hypothetical protein